MGTTDDIDLQLSVTPTSGTRFAGQAPTPVRFKDIIVTVHGIGQQIRYSTVRYVATQLAASQALKGTSTHRPVAPQALGYFQLVIDPQPLLSAWPAPWPVLLAGGLFLYLWWHATLVLDLAFVWHRYIGRNVAPDRLVEWSKHKQR